jgi:hypothetical protein
MVYVNDQRFTDIHDMLMKAVILLHNTWLKSAPSSEDTTTDANFFKLLKIEERSLWQQG